MLSAMSPQRKPRPEGRAPKLRPMRPSSAPIRIERRHSRLRDHLTLHVVRITHGG